MSIPHTVRRRVCAIRPTSRPTKVAPIARLTVVSREVVEFGFAGLGVAIMTETATVVTVSETCSRVLTKGTRHTMALDHAALLEVLDALKAGDADERVRVAAETMAALTTAGRGRHQPDRGPLACVPIRS